MKTPPRILAIAGSDSSGGAGIQADIKTATMLGGYAMSAITAITVQNTTGVQGVETLSAELVVAQAQACLDDIGADAIKIGMLGSPETARAVADLLAGFEGHVVFDPVMVATSGAVLADAETIDAFAALMRRATLATPNLPELAALTGMACTTPDEIAAAAHRLAQDHGCAVLAKGGHDAGERVIDRLVYTNGDFASFEDQRIDTRHTHGTGCTLASAIATLLGHGLPLDHAVRLGRRFVIEALRKAPGFGAGHGPLGHQAVRGGGDASAESAS
ncbi:bifunctional hydroxymethylpyrimidine kinase/phosphomethylpyrimidine kinase [Pelagerythrobacter marensis]|uniref:hydroxymethylpyrimidine kinase n=1 Tax=Pelagerythrobacter marensis TaxID=543877 RepID=A0ABZ2DAH9_9SPHN